MEISMSILMMSSAILVAVVSFNIGNVLYFELSIGMHTSVVEQL